MEVTPAPCWQQHTHAEQQAGKEMKQMSHLHRGLQELPRLASEPQHNVYISYLLAQSSNVWAKSRQHTIKHIHSHQMSEQRASVSLSARLCSDCFLFVDQTQPYDRPWHVLHSSVVSDVSYMCISSSSSAATSSTSSGGVRFFGFYRG